MLSVTGDSHLQVSNTQSLITSRRKKENHVTNSVLLTERRSAVLPFIPVYLLTDEKDYRKNLLKSQPISTTTRKAAKEKSEVT